MHWTYELQREIRAQEDRYDLRDYGHTAADCPDTSSCEPHYRGTRADGPFRYPHFLVEIAKRWEAELKAEREAWDRVEGGDDLNDAWEEAGRHAACDYADSESLWGHDPS